MIDENILEVKSLSKSYSVYSNLLQLEIDKKIIFKNLSFVLKFNTSLGVLGASGVGKTTLIKIVSRIEEPDSGEIILDGKNIKEYDYKEFATKLQLLFQNSFSMLNPRYKIKFLIKERVKQYFKLNNLEYNKKIINQKIEELLEITKLPKTVLDAYPYQLSGGQKQRVAILLIISLYPKIIILDEPLSALDISLQAQMLNFFLELKEKFKLSYIFITHDRNLAEYFCDNILVLHEGGSYEIK